MSVKRWECIGGDDGAFLWRMDRGKTETLRMSMSTPVVLSTDHEAAVAALEARLGELRAALERISAIENHYGGGDWDEIEEARAIAIASLTAGKGEA